MRLLSVFHIIHIYSKCFVTDIDACRDDPYQNGGTCNDFTDYYSHWRTGGGGGALAPQINFNHGLFSMHRQNIERNSSLRM